MFILTTNFLNQKKIYIYVCIQIAVIVQSLSHVQSFATPWTSAHQASLSVTVSWSLFKPMSIESVMPSNHLIFCHPLLLLPSIFPSIRVFFNQLALPIRWPNQWRFSFISPSNEYSGLISFSIDEFDLLALQQTLKILLQHHSLEETILQCSAFFIVKLSHPYMTTGKTIACIQTHICVCVCVCVCVSKYIHSKLPNNHCNVLYQNEIFCGKR